MTIERRITETIERELGAVDPPPVDIAAVRRVGRRRARIRAGVAAASVAVVVGGIAVAGGLVGEGNARDDQVVQPVGVPRMDFDNGLQAWFNPDDNHVHMGGQEFDIGAVTNLDTSASATPYGLVYFGEAQDVRLLTADGTVEVLAPAPDDPDSFGPTVKYDATRPLAAWLTKSDGAVTLTVYRFGAPGGVIGEFDVPCGGECDGLSVAGVDQGLVFVRDTGGSRVIDPMGGPKSAWTTVTRGRIADVRNRVILMEAELPDSVPTGGPLDESWRFATAQGPESLLTFDGAHEIYWSATLPSTTPGGGDPLQLDLPPGKGVVFVNTDTDGSVLVARMGRSGETWFDCEVPSGRCREFDRSLIQSGDPGFIGNDM